MSVEIVDAFGRCQWCGTLTDELGCLSIICANRTGVTSPAADPVGEAVTLSDGSVVTVRGDAMSRDYLDGKGFEVVGRSWRWILTNTDTGADFDALKAFAARVGGGR